MAERKTGSVKWFNAVKGFGFVTPAEGGEDLFVHQSNIKTEGFRSLREGESVEFDVEAGEDGRAKAINVTGPEGSAPQGAPPRPSHKGQAGAGRGVAGGRGGRMDRSQQVPGRGGGFYPGHYPAMPPQPFYVGYYFPQAPGTDPSMGRGGRGRMGGRGPPGPMYFPGGVPPGMPGNPMQQQPMMQPSGLQVVVHNLPWTCTWQQLKDHFKDFKVERADVLLDQYGRSRGFGTVRLMSTADAEAACQALNNSKIEDRTISVRLDRFA